MISRKVIVLVALVLLAEPASRVAAQSVPDVLSQFQSDQYEVRREAFYRIFGIANAGYPGEASLGPGAERLARFGKVHPDVASGLIALLERESRPDPAKDSLSEDSYYGDLIGCVAELRDPRAVRGLLASIVTGGMAEDGLEALGHAAVPDLLEKLRDPTSHFFARSAAASVLGRIATQTDVAGDTAAIRTGLLLALGDTSMYVRSHTVRALRSFHGSDVRRVVRKVAENDPAVEERAGKRSYPVRAEAREWLSSDSLTAIHRGTKP